MGVSGGREVEKVPDFMTDFIPQDGGVTDGD